MKKTALICLGALMISCILIVNGFSNNDVVAGNDDESKEYEYEYYYNNDKARYEHYYGCSRSHILPLTNGTCHIKS